MAPEVRHTPRISKLRRSIQNEVEEPPLAAGLGVTRHPGADAAG